MSLQTSSRRFFLDLKRYQKSIFKHCAKASISEARSKLPWQAIQYLLSQSQIEDPKALWRGHSVRAVDGTCVITPKSEDLLKYFPPRKSLEHYPRARVTAAVDTITGQAVFAEVGDIYTSEPAMLSRLLQHFKPGDIVLLDRGFTGAKLWNELAQQDLFFVNRLPILSQDGSLSQQILKSKKNDLTLVYKGQKLRFIKGKKRKNRPRLIIATNLLDANKYGRKALLDLYKSRWAIETFFKQLKQTLHLKNFHAKTHNGIMQEVFGSLLMMSLINGMIWLANSQRPKSKINFKAAADAVWMHLQLFCSGHRSGNSNDLDFQELFDWIVAITEKIRPGRHFPRLSKQTENKWIKARRSNNHVEKGHHQWSNKYR